MTAVRQLLPLLDFTRLGGNPLNNPTPWSWATWMEYYPNARAPWAGPRWTSRTGFSRQEWQLSRDFLVAFYAAGDNHEERCAFATSLSEGPLFDGLQLVAERFADDWYRAGFDKLIKVVLDSMEITNLNELYMHLVIGLDIKDNVAKMLLGRDAFGPTGLHPSAANWVSEILNATMERWKDIHNQKALDIAYLQRKVFFACLDVSAPTCNAQNIVTYLDLLSSLVKQLDLTFNNERQRQLDYYRDLLSAIGELLEARYASSTRMPYNMRHALMNLTSPHDRADIKTSLAACWDVLDMASDQAPPFSALFNAYDKICKDSLSLVVGFLDVDVSYLEENPEQVEVESQLWENEKQAAYMFAALTLPHVRE